MKINYKRLIVKYIKLLWICLYAIPLAHFSIWCMGIPSHFNLYIARETLPIGMAPGVLWLIANAIICLGACLFAVLLILPIGMFVIWKVEDLIVTKWMNKRIRSFLELENYQSLIKNNNLFKRTCKKP